MGAIISDQIEILDIRARPALIEGLVQMSYDYWQKPEPLWSTKEWSSWFNEALDTSHEPLPRCWAAMMDGNAIGSVSLVIDGELSTKKDLSPWLDGLIVVQSLRGHGFGTMLHNYAIDQAKLLGFKQIYLWTEAQSEWYGQLGWKVLEQSNFGDLPITIMTKVLE